MFVGAASAAMVLNGFVSCAVCVSCVCEFLSKTIFLFRFDVRCWGVVVACFMDVFGLPQALVAVSIFPRFSDR